MKKLQEKIKYLKTKNIWVAIDTTYELLTYKNCPDWFGKEGWYWTGNIVIEDLAKNNIINEVHWSFVGFDEIEKCIDEFIEENKEQLEARNEQ